MDCKTRSIADVDNQDSNENDDVINNINEKNVFKDISLIIVQSDKRNDDIVDCHKSVLNDGRDDTR